MSKDLSRNEIEQKMKDILTEKLCLDLDTVIKPEMKLADDLGADSLDAIDCMIEIEKEFEISISDDKMDALQNSTVDDIVTMIEQYLSKNNEP